MEQCPVCGKGNEVIYRLDQAEKAIEYNRRDLVAHEENGDVGHVQRHEVRALRKDVDTVTQEHLKLCDAVRKDQEDHRLAAAKRESTTRLLIALVGAAITFAQYAFTHLLK